MPSVQTEAVGIHTGVEDPYTGVVDIGDEV